MRLSRLIEDLPIEIRRGPADVDVRGVTDDSRRVGGGDLFVARPGGTTDGRRYVADAVAAGAAAVLTPRDVDDAGGGSRGDGGPTHLVCDDVARWGAVIAERCAGRPSERLRLVGVTGTNGKTTVSFLLRQILEGAGWRCGLMGTVMVDVGDGAAPRPASLTTPSAFEISPDLARMVRGECRACVMEVSSHALAQDRTAGLHFAGAVFTNLSGDHLDYHATRDEYVAAKTRLFAKVPADGWAVINGDDDAAEAMRRACRGRVVTTSVDGPGRGAGTGTPATHEAGARAAIGAASSAGTDALFSGPWGEWNVHLPLVGRHNVANALQAATAAHLLGADDAAILTALAHLAAPPGRLEPVTGPADAFTVLVDYAHTDDALENVLRAARQVVPPGGRLHVVFGCGGDRDATKRPRMGRVAAALADEVVVTSDNPRTEEPGRIVEAVAAGIPPAAMRRTRRIVDRAEAIAAAIGSAGPGDVVVIAGKGHETYQIVGTERRPFDDRVVARVALDARASAAHGTSGAPPRAPAGAR